MSGLFPQNLEMSHVERGRIAPKPGALLMRPRYTFIAETGKYLHILDGPHKAARFRTSTEALDVAALCNGPWFNLPDRGTVQAAEAEMALAATV